LQLLHRDTTLSLHGALAAGARRAAARRRSAHLKAAAPAKARLNLASTVNIFMTNHPVEIPRISSTI